ncbi:hypothetical protein DPEC_G00082750 [Dallia pectoralis]|uniref:Uncharacterized protein n=1 Tax=Dallia pectoralis TaxID=75939 RepID=A0ACC2GYV4_DALPE|nr:hypothetical protein DPEC_G00082750 [Dallia pectoralis]
MNVVSRTRPVGCNSGNPCPHGSFQNLLEAISIAIKRPQQSKQDEKLLKQPMQNLTLPSWYDITQSSQKRFVDFDFPLSSSDNRYKTPCKALNRRPVFVPCVSPCYNWEKCPNIQQRNHRGLFLNEVIVLSVQQQRAEKSCEENHQSAWQPGTASVSLPAGVPTSTGDKCPSGARTALPGTPQAQTSPPERIKGGQLGVNGAIEVWRYGEAE